MDGPKTSSILNDLYHQPDHAVPDRVFTMQVRLSPFRLFFARFFIATVFIAFVAIIVSYPLTNTGHPAAYLLAAIFAPFAIVGGMLLYDTIMRGGYVPHTVTIDDRGISDSSKFYGLFFPWSDIRSFRRRKRSFLDRLIFFRFIPYLLPKWVYEIELSGNTSSYQFYERSGLWGLGHKISGIEGNMQPNPRSWTIDGSMPADFSPAELLAFVEAKMAEINRSPSALRAPPPEGEDR